MDLQPRMITLALSDDLWVSYNASTGELYRAWPGGVDFAGPVYNQAHGPQPTSIGPAYLVGDGGGAFVVRSGGAEYVPEVRFRGHRVEGSLAVLLYTVVLADGTEATVTESPERIGGSNGGGRLTRTFTTDGIPTGVEIGVRTDSADPAHSRLLVPNGTTVIEHVLDGTPIPPFRSSPTK